MRPRPTERQLALILRKFAGRLDRGPPDLTADEEAEIAPFLEPEPDSLHRDREGRPISLWEWAARFENHDYRRVAETHLPNGYVVSTVWCGTLPGSLFETAHWRGNGAIEVDRRHSSEQHGRIYHEELAKRLMRKP